MESSIEALSRYRFEAGGEALADARLMYENGRYKNALNRGYYAIFHSIRAVNSLDGFDSSKHSGVIAYFNQNYVKSGKFPKEVSGIIKQASEHREKADYLDFFVASGKEAEKQIERAEKFRGYIKEYLEKMGILQ
jgi:uncharacterized protein (UPF0332 family)